MEFINESPIRIVKYDNVLNSTELGRLNPVELDIFLTICALAKEEGTKNITFSFDNLRKIMNYDATKGKKRFIDEIKKTNSKLLSLNMSLKNENKKKTVQFALFTTFSTDETEETLEIKVNEDFSFILNDLTKNFTRFELKEYTDINSKYSKIIYQLLKQYRRTGILIIGIDEFRKILNIPETYRMSEINKRVLTPAMEELQKYFKNLHLKKIKGGKTGNAIVELQFFFDKEAKYEKAEKNEATQEPNAIDEWMFEVPVFSKQDDELE